MLSKFFQRIAAKKIEKRFHNHFVNAIGSDLQRNAIAVAMMELEDPNIERAAQKFSQKEQPIFLMAYQCFILWILRKQLQQRAQASELEEITRSVKSRFATFKFFNEKIFEEILEKTQELMPIALQGGKNTKIVYPLTHIILAANMAGYTLPQTTLGYDFGVHILTVMQRVAFTFDSEQIAQTKN
jgi:hypothetical protein